MGDQPRFLVAEQAKAAVTDAKAEAAAAESSIDKTLAEDAQRSRTSAKTDQLHRRGSKLRIPA